MRATVEQSQQRLEMRIPAETKQVIEEAAQLRGLTVSAYVLSVVSKAAQEEVERSTLTSLSNADRDAFLRLIDSAPQPSENLKKAAARHKEALGGS